LLSLQPYLSSERGKERSFKGQVLTVFSSVQDPQIGNFMFLYCRVLAIKYLPRKGSLPTV